MNTPVSVYDWDTGKKSGEFTGHTGTTWGVAVSRSGKMVATCGSDGEVLLRDFSTGNVIRKHEFAVPMVWSVAFSPDGAKLAASCGDGAIPEESNLIRLWDVATGQELHRLKGHTKDVRWVTFSADGKTLASAGFDGTIRLWDLVRGKETSTISATTPTPNGCSSSRAGSGSCLAEAFPRTTPRSAGSASGTPRADNRSGRGAGSTRGK